MGIKAIRISDVHKRAVERLGLDPSTHDLASIEALAANLRRAAAFHCPASPITLSRAVLRSLQGLVSDLPTVSELVESTLDAITAYGDLLESRDVAAPIGEQNLSNLLYVAPPGFVMRENGSALLMGIASDRVSALPDDLDQRVEYENHIRRLPAGIVDLRARLLDGGLLELSSTAWLRCPPPESPEALVTRLDRQLAGSPLVVTGIDGLTVLDPAKPVTYYRGRWTDKPIVSASVIGRRPQAYGADIWCYVELAHGRPRRFVDLPLLNSRYRGCDEAWHLQAALDAIHGAPQQYRLRTDGSEFVTIDFFSPIPTWAQRRLDAIGQRVAPVHCLLSYRVPKNETEEERAFLRSYLWLNEITGTEDQR